MVEARIGEVEAEADYLMHVVAVEEACCFPEEQTLQLPRKCLRN